MKLKKLKKKARRIVLMSALPLLAVAPRALAAPSAALSGGAAAVATLPPSVASESPAFIEMALRHAAPDIRPAALRAALAAWGDLKARGEVFRPLLTVIDYGLPSTTKRMWVFDLASCRLLFHELVAHGRNSGEDVAQSFSNEPGSLMTSLGAFVTGAAYTGHNGYSLRLQGMEPGVNDRAEARVIVVHGAAYVGEEVAHQLGRLGRSFGCPAVRPAIARPLIEKLKNRTLLYAWHPSMNEAARPAEAGSTLAALDADGHGSATR